MDSTASSSSTKEVSAPPPYSPGSKDFPSEELFHEEDTHHDPPSGVQGVAGFEDDANVDSIISDDVLEDRGVRPIISTHFLTTSSLILPRSLVSALPSVGCTTARAAQSDGWMVVWRE